MAIFKDFKEFAFKGNVVDLAVGVIIGAAFNNIVKSLVDDIITPTLLTPALEKAGLKNLSELTIEGTAIKYGSFLSTCITFMITAFALFLIIQLIHRHRKTEAEKPAVAPAPTNEEKLLIEIRDALKNRPL